MKNTRRIKRMSRGKKKKISGMNLVSLMDVFTILVFFLLVNSSTSEELSDPKTLDLPDSVAELKPEQTLIVMVTPKEIFVKGESIVTVEAVLEQKGLVVESIRTALETEVNSTPSLNSSTKKRKEIIIMGDKQIPFRLLKKVMASCTSAGFEKISLAVVQKASQA